MKNYMKVAFLSLAVLVGITGGSFANKDLPEFERSVVTACGEVLTGSEVDLTASELLNRSIVEGKEEPAESALSIFGGYAAAGAGWVGQKLYNLGYAGAESLGRQAIAYGASYYGIVGLKEAFSCTVYGAVLVGVALTGGSAFTAAAGAYTTTKGVFTLLSVVPGIDGVLALTIGRTLPVQSVTDTILNNTPAALKAGASLAQAGASTLASVGSTLASYFW